MSLSKRDNDDLRNLHNASSGPSKPLPRASDSGQGSAKWTQPPTLIPIPGNQSRQPPKQSAARSGGWNPYTASRFKSTMDQGKKGGAPSLNLTSGATVLGKNGPTPSKRRRIDLNSPRPASSSKYFLGQQPSSRRSRPLTSHTGIDSSTEITILDEDRGVGTSGTHHPDDKILISDDEMLLTSDPSQHDLDSPPRASTSKLPPDGAFTQRLERKLGERGHRREDAIRVDDNDPIEEFPEIKSGIVEEKKAMLAAVSQPPTTATRTKTKEVDLKRLLPRSGGIKANMRSKGEKLKTQPVPIVNFTDKNPTVMSSDSKNRTKGKAVGDQIILPMNAWSKGLEIHPATNGPYWLVLDKRFLHIRAKLPTGGSFMSIRFLDLDHVERSTYQDIEEGPIIIKLWFKNSPKDGSETFQRGSRGMNGCICLNLRADTEDWEDGRPYRELFRFLQERHQVKLKDLDSSHSTDAWQRVENACELKNRQVSSHQDAASSPSSVKQNELASRSRPTRATATLSRVTRASQKKIEEPEPERRSPDADKLILVYPFSGTGAVNVTKGDLRRLHPGEYLNDTLIEFGLKLWLEGVRDHDPILADQIHVFSSFFYKKINIRKKEQGYQSVRKWTAKIDLFSKKYIIVPINEHVHWYLAIICNPEYVLLEPPPEAPKETFPSTGPVTRKRKRIEDSPEPELPDPPPPPSKLDADGAQSASRPTSPKGDIVPDSEDEREDVATQSTKKADDDGDTIEVEHLLKRSCSLNDNDELSSNQEMGRSSPMSSIQLGEDQLAYPSETDEMAVDVSSTATPAVESNDSISTLPRAMRVDEPSSPEVPYGGSISAPLDQLSPVPPNRFYHSSGSRKAEKKPATLGDINLADAEPEGEPPGDEEVVTKSGEPEPNKTYIFTFDSLGSDHRAVITTLGRYLQFEAKDKKGKELDQTSVALGRPAFVPYQPNYCDCGVYVFHFVERFMSDPEKYTRLILSKVKKSDYPSAERDRDWGHEVVPSMRASLTSRVEELSQQWQKYTEEMKAQKKAEAAAAGISAEVTAIDDDDSDIEVIVTSDPKKPVRKAMRLR